MTYQDLRYEVEEGYAVVTLNRPKVLNALSRRMREEIAVAMEQAGEDDSVRSVILTGEGRGFCAGADLTEPEATEKETSRMRETISSYLRYVFAVWDCPKPVIAAINGVAVGGGCDLALAADVTLASEQAFFGAPEIRYSSSPPTLIMPWVVGLKKVKELLLTGDVIAASAALAAGMVNQVYPHDQLFPEARKLARKLGKIPLLALRMNKESINRTYEIMGFRQAMQAHNDLSAVLETAPTPERLAFEKACAERGIRQAAKEVAARFEE